MDNTINQLYDATETTAQLASMDERHAALLLQFAQTCYADGEHFRRYPDLYTLTDIPPGVEDAAYTVISYTLTLSHYRAISDSDAANHLGQWAFLLGASSRRWEQ